MPNSSAKHTAKYTLKPADARLRFKQRLLEIPHVTWREQTEQYCDYRLDGRLSQTWCRAKQFGNGTLYLEAGDETALAMMVALLDSEEPIRSERSKPVSPVSKGKTPSIPGLTSIPGLIAIEGSYIGTDESGKGDYFGPLVVAGVMVTPESQEKLAKLGVMDSKKLTDKQILSLSPQIIAIVGESACSIVEMGPKAYNGLYDKFRASGKNLNHLLAWGHATALENILGNHPECVQAIADQFGNESFLTSHLKEKGKKIQLFQTPKAEANIGVAAASILARGRFAQKMAKLSEQFQMPLSFGAGPQVLRQAKQFVARYGFERLFEVAKVHFKTTNEVRGF